jgi:hypothetical protein
MIFHNFDAYKLLADHGFKVMLFKDLLYEGGVGMVTWVLKEIITKTHHNCGYGLKKAPPFIFLTENQQFDLTA